MYLIGAFIILNTLLIAVLGTLLLIMTHSLINIVIGVPQDEIFGRLFQFLPNDGKKESCSSYTTCTSMSTSRNSTRNVAVWRELISYVGDMENLLTAEEYIAALSPPFVEVGVLTSLNILASIHPS